MPNRGPKSVFNTNQPEHNTNYCDQFQSSSQNNE